MILTLERVAKHYYFLQGIDTHTIMNYIQELQHFLDHSPSAFHSTQNIREQLLANGFTELCEGDRFDIQKGGKYFVTRNNSSIIALKIGHTLDQYGFMMAASHSDSPSFKLKEKNQIRIRDKYTSLNTEGYGGMLCATWFDRPLSVAGRVIVKEDQKFITKLVNIDQDLLIIPSLAIHMNRNANDGLAFNKQIDLLPLLGMNCEDNAVMKRIAKELHVDLEHIFGSDLFLYSRTPSTLVGVNQEFISSTRLDDLECAYTSLKGFLESENEHNVQVYICFDNEEVGSQTKQGAASTFLKDVLQTVNTKLGKDEEDLRCAFAKSFLVSCDNAHAVHPNQPEKTDALNCSYMNEGIVIKSHAGQKYTSDAVSMAITKEICHRANVPYQYFANRSDSVGGSTLGNILLSQVSVNAADIGLAQLAMHSAYETAGTQDVASMISFCREFFNSTLDETDAFTYLLGRSKG